MDDAAFSNLLTLGLLFVALLALGASLYSAWSASRSAAAAEQSAQAAQGVLDHRREETREYWISKLEERIRSSLKERSGPRGRVEPVALLLKSLPPSLRDEEQELVELAYKRATTERGFPAFWQVLEGVRGRGTLADTI